MQAIARCNGAVLIEDGKRIGVVQQSGEHLSTLFYALALFTFVLAANGVTQLFFQPLVGVGLLIACVPAGVATAHVKRAFNALGEAPVKAQPWLVFDLETGRLRNGAGQELAALENITVRRSFNAFSSSRSLCVKTPDASLVIARGNPFGESVDGIEDALRARGIRVV